MNHLFLPLPPRSWTTTSSSWSAGPPCQLFCPQGSFQEQIWPASGKRVLRGMRASPAVYALACITGGACVPAVHACIAGGACTHAHCRRFMRTREVRITSGASACAHRRRCTRTRTRASPAVHAHAHRRRFMRTRAAHAHAHRRRFMCTRTAPITGGACARASVHSR